MVLTISQAPDMFFYRSFLFISILASLACSSEDQSPSAEKPNIILLFTDDQTYHSIRSLGNEEIHTPNYDRLVSKGTAFTHAYNMGGWHGAVCVASRSMMIAGVSVWKAREWEQRWINKDSLALQQTWGRMMSDAGYDTYFTGKWHVAAPVDGVFDTVRHPRPGMPPDAWGKGGGGRRVAEAMRNNTDIVAAMPPGYNYPSSRNDDSWSPSDTSFGGFWSGGKHWSEVVRDDATDYIAQAAQIDKPFFMYLAFNAPHDPRQSPQRFVDMYPVDDIEVPGNYLDEYPWKDEIGCGVGLRDEALAPFPRTEYAVQKHRQEYYAIISHLDEQIGNILDAVEESGKADNTYIFLTADHGLSVGQHGLLGKQNLFDHSVRVPLIMSGPGIPKGAVRDQDVYLQDIMATSLELASIPKPSHIDFHSFLDIIEDEAAPSHYPAIYGCYRMHQRMIRKDGYKLISYPTMNRVLLYDLINDPLEINDISEVPEHKDRVSMMVDELIELQQEMGDTLSLGSS